MRNRFINKIAVLAFVASFVANLGALGIPANAAPAPTVSVTTPNSQVSPFGTYVVPNGVTQIQVTVRGGAGGEQGTSAGASPAVVMATLNVTPGEVIQYVVGGAGGLQGGVTPGLGGYNGGGDGGAGDVVNWGNWTNGGGGGGATDIRVCATASTSLCSLSDRILVAGGGGGRANYYGGKAGLLGSSANSGNDSATQVSPNGGGASMVAGGASGLNDLSIAPPTDADGTAGSLGFGGTGASPSMTYVAGGAGGGGGYFGGGGGAARGGGGGGGSSIAPSSTFKASYYSGTPATSYLGYVSSAADLPGSLTITPAPAAPALQSSLGGLTKTDLTLTVVPASTGGAPYQYVVKDLADPYSTCIVAASASPLTCDFFGLTSGQTYNYVAYADTGSGYMDWSGPQYMPGGVLSATSAQLSVVAGSYKVTFDANGGSGSMTPQMSDIPATLSASTFTPPTGSRFRAWNTAANGSGTWYGAGANYSFAADVTLYAQWTGGPVVYSTQQLTSGGVAQSSIAIPDTVIGQTTNLTIYMTNSSSTRPVTFGNLYVYNTNGLIKNGGTCGTNTVLAAGADCTVLLTWTPSTSASLSSLSAGMEVQIAGYYDTVAFTGAAISTHTVIFHANDGSGNPATDSQTASATTSLRANSFSKVGYAFAGWATSPAGAVSYADGALYNFGSNQDLYAQWIQAVFTVHFDAGGGAGSMGDQSSRVAANLNGSTFTRNGYSFSGWNTQADGTGSNYSDGQSYAFTSSVTLFAQWRLVPVRYLMNFDSQGGNASAVASFSVGEFVHQAVTPERDGYRFEGWFLAPVGGDPISWPYRPGGASLTVYAHWAPYAVVVPAPVTPPTTEGSGSSQENETTNPSAQAITKLTVSGFAPGSARLTKLMKETISNFVAKNSALSVAQCKGYTQGPTVLRTDAALALARANAVCEFARNLRMPTLTKVASSYSQETRVASTVRRVVITLKK